MTLMTIVWAVTCSGSLHYWFPTLSVYVTNLPGLTVVCVGGVHLRREGPEADLFLVEVYPCGPLVRLFGPPRAFVPGATSHN
jgi:hypothetical protein